MKSGPNTISRLLIDSQKLVDTMTSNPGFSLGDLGLSQLIEAQNRATKLSEQVEAKRVEMVGLANERDTAASTLRDMATRLRSGIRAFYGPDSSQYEQAGGVRNSERKARSTPKKLASAASNRDLK